MDRAEEREKGKTMKKMKRTLKKRNFSRRRKVED